MGQSSVDNNLSVLLLHMYSMQAKWIKSVLIVCIFQTVCNRNERAAITQSILKHYAVSGS